MVLIEYIRLLEQVIWGMNLHTVSASDNFLKKELVLNLHTFLCFVGEMMIANLGCKGITRVSNAVL